MVYIITYNEFTLFETIFLSYFLKDKVKYVSLENKEIKSFENIQILADTNISNVKISKDDLLIIPGGNISNILDNKELENLVKNTLIEGIKVGAICAGVDYLNNIKCLENYKNVKINAQKDLIFDKNLITANANAYLEFAIEISKIMGVFKDENDYNETYDFFKNKKLYSEFK
ncbi:DJ-1/PfpI family protein [Oceanivirga salmonicida]|uniref:DJ-1/PfpI family protein n=1 Tax=Oceanivirga salmonicida TaxID=1769291 RepID=UPI00082DA859|nr:DJ-1/PfpI family protein [Oceanivirga salmonicida]